MTKRKGNKKALIVFVLIAVLSGWIGRGIDFLLGSSGESTPGQLVWLILPLLTVLVIKKIFKRSQSSFGVKPLIKANKKYYRMSILFFSIILVGYLSVGLLFNFISFNNISVEVIIPIFISMIFAQTFKNIFEEFSWRGYLAPELTALKVNRYISYFIVGIVWALWHIPYNHLFMDVYRTTTTIWYYPLFFVGIIVLSFVYGEIRYRVNSVWPSVIMHTIGNVLYNTLILSELLNLQKADSLVTSIGVEGAIIIGISLLLMFYTLKMSKYKETAFN